MIKTAKDLKKNFTLIDGDSDFLLHGGIILEAPTKKREAILHVVELDPYYDPWVDEAMLCSVEKLQYKFCRR